MNSTRSLAFLMVAFLTLPNDTDAGIIEDETYRTDTDHGGHDAGLGYFARVSRNATTTRDSLNIAKHWSETAKKRTRRCSPPLCARMKLTIDAEALNPTKKPCTQEPCTRIPFEFPKIGSRVVTPPPAPAEITTASPPKPHGDHYIYQFQEQCGKRYSDTDDGKILHGRLVRRGEFTWTVALMIGTNTHPQCGGTLVTDRHVLTAGHCTDGIPASSIRVRAGHRDIDKANPSDDIEVEYITRHPAYNAFTFDADIAILKLRTAVPVTGRTSTCCLPDEYEHGGLNGHVMGWGSTDSTSELPAQRLQQVVVPIITNDECSRRRADGHRLITHNMVCAGHKNTDGYNSCTGDSGGPLVIRNNRTDRFYLEGIVSWGSRVCGDGQKPRVFARVAAFNHWIINNVRI